jgi:integrase/recombinase XerD
MSWTQERGRRKVCRVLERTKPMHRGFLEDFEEWLREVRLLAPVSVAQRLRFARDFVEAVTGDDGVEATVRQLSPAQVELFFVEYSAGRALNTRRAMAATLRLLLGFSALQGWVGVDLAESVPSVFSYRLSGIPAGISDVAIDRVLDVLKPSSATRCRDRAVLLLLATYGPRTGQISDLRLANLAWRERQITFCAQKRGVPVRHVLTPTVAEAIAVYLREHRPEVDHDHVFVRHREQPTPLSPAAIRGLVKNRLREAAIDGGPCAPRAFRYALATRLLNARQPYKLIADSLGHQSSRATAVYAKMDRPYLEEAAAEWQELDR